MGGKRIAIKTVFTEKEFPLSLLPFLRGHCSCQHKRCQSDKQARATVNPNEPPSRGKDDLSPPVEIDNAIARIGIGG